MAVTMCQVMGFVLGVLGTGGIIAATAMDPWSTEDLFDNPVTAIFSYSGLWRNCVRQSSGFTECRPYFTILGLPGLFQAVRALMIVGIVLGAIGSLIAIFALKCIRMGSMEDSVKATMTLASGVMFILGGICGIAGVSIFANLIVVNFNFTTYSSGVGFGGGGGFGGVGGGGFGNTLAPRYTFGSALFVGWIGGAVLVVGGIMMCLACRGMMPQRDEPYKGTSYRPPTQSAVYKPDGKPRTNYDESFRAHSMDGRQLRDYV